MKNKMKTKIIGIVLLLLAPTVGTLLSELNLNILYSQTAVNSSFSNLQYDMTAFLSYLPLPLLGISFLFAKDSPKQ